MAVVPQTPFPVLPDVKSAHHLFNNSYDQRHTKNVMYCRSFGAYGVEDKCSVSQPEEYQLLRCLSQRELAGLPFSLATGKELMMCSSEQSGDLLS